MVKKKNLFLSFMLTGTIVITPIFHTVPVFAEKIENQNESETVYETLESQSDDITGESETKTESQSTDFNDPDLRTEALLNEYGQLLLRPYALSNGSYEEELVQFPADYQVLLQELHKKHPGWVFVAVDVGLDWNTVVDMESRSSLSGDACFSLLPSYSGKLLLSKVSTDYNASTGTYIVKDGNDWVSASKPAVAYYLDPRNFLTEENIFQFETFAYNEQFHTLAGVEAVLNGTDLYNRTISYLNTAGNKVATSLTYGEAIYAAGIKYGISPVVLASKIRQETSGSLSHGSISGNYSYNGVSYRGYYNFYNINATPVSSDKGSAIANGLIYAKGGSSGTETSYGRPWTSPILSIDGGADFMANGYLTRGQNTIYFKKFNVVAQPYYYNQYMQNLFGAESEGRTTYNSYKNCGILDSEFVFYIPVYRNMPAYQSTVSIQKNVNTGKTTDVLSLRSGPSTAYPVLMEIPSGGTITVHGGIFTDTVVSVAKKLYDPYWLQVSYGSYTGYVSAEFVTMNKDIDLKVGQTKQLTVSCRDSVVYYETSNPAVALVSSTGLITAVGTGTCTVYAVNQSGTRIDCVGIQVGNGLSTPALSSAQNGTQGVNVTWNSVENAEGYYVYRKTSGSNWKRIAALSGNSTVKYTDKTAESGTTYIYTVRAYQGDTLSGYDAGGVSVKYLVKPTLSGAVNGVYGVTVKWEKVTGAEGYYVYRKNGNGNWKKIGTVSSGSAVSYIDRTAASGTSYIYTVRAYSGSTMSGYDAAGKSIDYLAKPELSSVVNGVYGVTVKWEKVTGASGYYVYRKSGSGNWKKIGTVSSGGTVSYSDKTASSGTTYTYTVRAYCGSNLSGYDPAGKSVKYLAKPELSGAVNGGSGITVKWSKVTSADGFYVYRKTSGGNWKKIATVSSSTTSYLDQTVSSGTTYTYTVRAYSGSTMSGYDPTGKSAKH